MIELKADGIDFFAPDKFFHNFSYEIIESYTKEEFLKGISWIPKTPYLYWKLVNNRKIYLEV